MKRNVDMGSISDGKLYSKNDMVKADCKDCKDCYSCCGNMGNSLILDPFDIYNIIIATGDTFEGLLSKKYIELNVCDGVILPNIAMHDYCRFLDENKRCSIHSKRPGICRLFPLGRIYEDNSFSYFLQINECKKEERAKVKVKKWIGIDNIDDYEGFIIKWHYFLKDVGQYLTSLNEKDKAYKINMYMLNLFYIKPYALDSDFYPQFYERFAIIEEALT